MASTRAGHGARWRQSRQISELTANACTTEPSPAELRSWVCRLPTSSTLPVSPTATLRVRKDAHSDSTQHTHDRLDATRRWPGSADRSSAPGEASVSGWDRKHRQMDATFFQWPSIIRRSSRSARRSWWMSDGRAADRYSFTETCGVVSCGPVLRSPGETYLRDVLGGQGALRQPTHPPWDSAFECGSVVSPSHREPVAENQATSMPRQAPLPARRPPPAGHRLSGMGCSGPNYIACMRRKAARLASR
jgi:hypothetical protein